MNWTDPTARLALIERVGPDEYSRMQAEHMRKSVVETLNGYAIRRVHAQRFGTIFMVDPLGRGSSTLDGARALARQAPPRPRTATAAAF